jgi:hypothetical protein
MSARETAELLLLAGRLVQAEGYDGELSPAQWMALRYFARANPFSKWGSYQSKLFSSRAAGAGASPFSESVVRTPSLLYGLFQPRTLRGYTASAGKRAQAGGVRRCRSVLICSDSALNQGQAFCIIGKGPCARRRWQRDRLRSRLKIREPNHATAIPTIAAAVR